LGREAKETGHSEVQRMLGGEEFGRVGATLLHRGKRKRDTDVGPTNPVSLPGVFKNRGDVGGCALDVNRSKA
jgi:hypothetical protein